MVQSTDLWHLLYGAEFRRLHAGRGTGASISNALCVRQA